MKKFETDSEKMSNEWVKETAKDNEDKFNALETRIEKKHSDLVNQLREGDSEDTFARKFLLMSMWGRAEGLAWADPVARTPMGAIGNSS